MQDEAAQTLPDQTARRYRNEQIFKLTAKALSGLLVGQLGASEEDLKRAAKTAVTAAKFAMSELIKERVI